MGCELYGCCGVVVLLCVVVVVVLLVPGDIVCNVPRCILRHVRAWTTAILAMGI